MAGMNTILLISPPPLGAIVPWTWEYSRIGEQTLPDHWLGVEPQMTESAWNVNGPFPDHNETERAQDSFGQTFVPADVRDLFQGSLSVAPRSGYTLAPSNQFTFVQEDENDRDSVELIRDIPFPYSIRLRLQKTNDLWMNVEYVVNGSASIPGSPPWYRLYTTFRTLIVSPALHRLFTSEAQGEGIQTDAYFDGDDAVLSILTDAHQIPPFDIYGEVISADTGFDVTIAGDGRISAMETADVRVRWDSRLTAGLRATFDGKEYTIVGTELESRNRFLRLALSRNVA